MEASAQGMTGRTLRCFSMFDSLLNQVTGFGIVTCMTNITDEGFRSLHSLHTLAICYVVLRARKHNTPHPDLKKTPFLGNAGRFST